MLGLLGDFGKTRQSQWLKKIIANAFDSTSLIKITHTTNEHRDTTKTRIGDKFERCRRIGNFICAISDVNKVLMHVLASTYRR